MIILMIMVIFLNISQFINSYFVAKKLQLFSGIPNLNIFVYLI